jgi:hypothetical protein
MPIGAVVGAAVVGGGASVIAANKNSSAIEKSTDTSLQANREAIAAQERAFQQQLAYNQSALNQGLQFQTDALNQNLSMQADSFNSTGKTQTAIYNNNVGTLNPFVQTGYAAMNQINPLLGLPEQKAYTPKNVAFDPVTARQITAPVVEPAPQPAIVPQQYNYGGY